MKDATGELSMTVVVIIAVIAIISIVYVIFGKNGVAKNWIDQQWGNMTQKGADGQVDYKEDKEG